MSYVVYEQKISRLLTMFRGSLIALIYEKTLRISPSNVDDTDVITLMSADIDRIESLTVIHELWSGAIEAGVAIWLLYNLLGTAIIAPLVWVAGVSPCSTDQLRAVWLMLYYSMFCSWVAVSNSCWQCPSSVAGSD